MNYQRFCKRTLITKEGCAHPKENFPKIWQLLYISKKLYITKVGEILFQPNKAEIEKRSIS